MRKGIALLCTVLLLCCVCGSSLAYLQSNTEEMVNVLTRVVVQTEITEVFDPEEAKNIVPGQEVAKVPKMKNTGTIDEYLVMKVKYVSEGSTTAAALKSQYLSLLWISNDWTIAADGDDYSIFYYNTPVQPGEYTSALFTDVRISSNWVDTCDFSIDLTGAAIQAEGVDITTVDVAGLFE